MTRFLSDFAAPGPCRLSALENPAMNPRAAAMSTAAAPISFFRVAGSPAGDVLRESSACSVASTFHGPVTNSVTRRTAPPRWPDASELE